MVESKISVSGDLAFRSKAWHDQKSRFKEIDVHSSWINVFAVW